jgi:predicted dehydrogenase
VRFGLAGTGYWARVAHARALVSTPGVELAAAWGRNASAAAEIARENGPVSHSTVAHSDFDKFLADVDAVAFSLPPHVQSDLATRAARAGKHLLLEKPVALTTESADRLAQAVTDAGVASVVFFTARFQATIRDWIREVAGPGWTAAQAVWLGSAVSGSGPFNTPWRQEKGGLWDLGPHVLSVLWATLGPVTSVLADGGQGDLSHLVLRHGGDTTSTVTLTVQAPAELDRFDFSLWGSRGRSVMPALAADPVPALRCALTELADNAAAGRTVHPCSVHLGATVTKVLADAQRQIDARRA